MYKIIDLSVPFSAICCKCWRIMTFSDPKYCIDEKKCGDGIGNGKYFCQECIKNNRKYITLEEAQFLSLERTPHK